MGRRAGRLTADRPNPLTPGLGDPPVANVGSDQGPASPEGNLIGRLVPGFSVENALEQRLANDPVMERGLGWGKPRPGHPEGTVGAHVSHLLETIDERGEERARRAELRFIALVHDTLKGSVKDWLPRTGENHHAMRARRFAECYSSDERLLATIELHDRPYSIWKRVLRTGEPQHEVVTEMLERVPDLGLFLVFVEIDGSTEGKDSEPVRWFRSELADRSAPG